MPESRTIGNDFLNKITGIIEEHISNEQFGVSQLAKATNMSRSNLLRKVKKLSGLSVSQFIRQVRLKRAMELLKDGDSTISEVTFEVGFNSTSYFIKCFREHYGYPPGEVGRHEFDVVEVETIKTPKKTNARVILIAALILVIAVSLFVFLKPFSNIEVSDKSIAVLPFKNDSNDSTNVYFINGLMESVLNNLQKIKDLKVISRTSVEKYRNSPMSIPEIAKELNVKYFIEGSGQKIGNQIVLHIQLIEADDDHHLWSEQYDREIEDVFDLQREVAENIAVQIQAIITPEEQQLIEKPPTDNLVAYDYFLKGLDFFFQGNKEGLEAAIPLFEKAVEHDPKFARAYADLAISYYYLDIYQAEKQYSNLINNYADKALFYDDKLSQSLLAKAFFYINIQNYELAEPYLQKALEYNPNSAFVINALSDFYDSRMPNTKKYLEYALKGIQVDVASTDSTSTSFVYLHLSNALVQSGFVEEAEKYINRSLQYDPENLYSAYVKAYILYAKHGKLKELKDQLIVTLQRDTTRIDIIQEVAKICYYLRDYKSAYQYYQKFLSMKTALNMDIYPFENAKIALVFSEVGLKEQSHTLLEEYLTASRQDNSIYKHLSLAAYYSYQNEPNKAIEHLKQFAQQGNFHYWIILFLKQDPLIDHIKDLPEFKRLYKEMEIKFWENHRELKASLKSKHLV